MPSPFLLALHATRQTPRALALVERTSGADGPNYIVRTLRRLTGDDPIAEALALTVSEPQFPARTLLVTTGGQPAADALRARGPSAAAVALLDEGTPTQNVAHTATVQELVNTFQRLYRAGAVEVPGALDAGSDAVGALAAVADLDASADDRDDARSADGLVDEAASDTLSGDRMSGDGPAPATFRQSGNQVGVSTERITTPLDPGKASALHVDAEVRMSRVAGASPDATPDLGEHADVALALALAVWFGETTRDELPMTDQADEVRATRRR